MAKTYNRVAEIVLACQKGVFFCHISKRGIGLTTQEVRGLDVTQSNLGQSDEFEAHRRASVFGQDQSNLNSKRSQDSQALPGYVITDEVTRVSNANPIVIDDQVRRQGTQSSSDKMSADLPAVKRRQGQTTPSNANQQASPISQA